jgi:hypothetical protein
LGSTTLNQTHQLTWTHAWSSRVTSNVIASYVDDKFQNAPIAAAGGANRHDRTASGGLRMTYEFRRWMRFGAEFLRSARDSNDPNFDYTRNQLMFLVSATL